MNGYERRVRTWEDFYSPSPEKRKFIVNIHCPLEEMENSSLYAGHKYETYLSSYLAQQSMGKSL